MAESTPSAESLLPCPFCGGDGVYEIIPTDEVERFPEHQCVIVACAKCRTTTDCFRFDREATTAWNTRQPSPAGNDAVRALVAKWRKTAFGLGADGRKAADRCADELEAALADNQTTGRV